jgi:hypothetical protein
MIRRPTLYFAASFVALCLSAPAAGTDPEEGFPMISTIAVTSTRDNPTLFGPALEIYLMDADGTKRTAPDRENTTGEAFAALSPDGKARSSSIATDSSCRRSLPTPSS